MWGTTGCDIVVIGRVIVGKFVRKFGRVGDGNSVDGNDGLVGDMPRTQQRSIELEI